MKECIEMKVSGVVMDPNSNTPIVVLKNDAGDSVLPIWIGVMEAAAIAASLEKVVPPRPMTHDLFAGTLYELGAALISVEIPRIAEGTFYAVLNLQTSDGVLEIDCRPSDAIALAMRARCPIHVTLEVVETAGLVVETPESMDDSEDSEKLKELLQNLPDDVFGKYKI